MQTSRLGTEATKRLGRLRGKIVDAALDREFAFAAHYPAGSLLRTSIKRSFFNKLFGRGPTAREEEPAGQAPSIITERRKESSYEKDSYKKQTPMSEEEMKFLKKKEEFLQSLAKKRDAQDSELEKRRKEIEEASTASRREFEITLASLDYGKIIQDNIAINRETAFESVEDLIGFIAKISNAKIKLTEENIVKVLHGYINYAPTLGKEAAQSREFAYLLNLLRSMIGALSQTESLLSMVAFLDLYCVDYPELWVKVEQRILNLKSSVPTKELLEILKHTSNQGEGTEYFYDQMEKRLGEDLKNLTISELALVLQIFFNVRRGTKDFIAGVFDLIVKKVDATTDVNTMTKVTLAVSEATDDMIPVSTIFDALDSWVSNYAGPISLEQACLLGFSFGHSHGSPATFKKLEKIVADQNEKIGLEELKLVLRGFVFNMRISKNLLRALKKKILGHQMELTPVEMSKILRAHHTIQVEDKELSGVFLNHILVSLQQYSHLLDQEDFYEVFFSLHKTRQGSREMYRTLDYILSLRLPEIIKDTQLTRRFYAVAGTSGLTDPELLKHLAGNC